MLVRATKRGFHRAIKEAGDVFEYPGRIDGSSWLVPADTPVEAPPMVAAVADDEPMTMCEIQKRRPCRPPKGEFRG